ncbi:LuxR C-terminal-related transcriptional regulator [Spirillospora sp. NPDC047279]|uniref:LuxR C-terminal-related transcriptional regulator n=1 Tax=Spirillospora sp. NPDC047279 TaxID=3155478 RepID=UPI0033EA3FE0
MSVTPFHTPPSTITIPVRQSWIIERPRLTARLERGVRGPLTVVTGPPGAGKTALVAAWAGRRDPVGRLAWTTCERGLDRARFWSRVVDALTLAGAIGPGFTPVIDRPGGAGDLFLADLAAALAGRPDPVILVLDDFQAPLCPGVAAGVAALIEAAWPSLRLVLVGRHDPPLPLHRYRLAQRLTEIRGDALAFGEREGRALLAQHGVDLPGGLLDALLRRTEGWAAGLRMAAMSMERRSDPLTFVARFAGDDHAVVGYLLEQVLDTQPEEVRRVLLRTSVAERFTAGLALELAGPEASAVFPTLVRENSFVMPAGDEWYRYHHMFAEGLRLLLRHEMPGEMAVLHRRAARWFSGQGLLADAVGHAVQAGDWTYACRSVVDELAVGEVLGLRGDPTLGEIFLTMPENVITSASDPAPALVAATAALGRGDDRGCARALGRAVAVSAESSAEPGAGTGSAPNAADRLTIEILRIARAAHRPSGEEPSLRAALATAEELLAGFPDELVARRPELRALISGARGTADFAAGRLAEAAGAFTAAIRASADCGADYTRRDNLGRLALVELLSGRFERAAEHAGKAAQEARRMAASAHLARAWVSLERHEPAETGSELDRADLALRESWEDGRRPADPCLPALHGLVGGRAALAARRPDLALDRLAAAQATNPPRWLSRRLLVVEAAAHVQRGDAAAALGALDGLDGHGGAEPVEAVVVRAQAQLAGGEPERAARTLRPALAGSASIPPDVRVAAWLLDAEIAYGSADTSHGRRSLDRALRLAEREHILLPFAMALHWLAPVLRHDPELQRAHQRHLDSLNVGPEGRSEPADPEIVERLSARELEVLVLLAGMLTTEEIALEMYVSVNTVKTHLKSIYRKLAVTRRGDAVRRARQLTLI